ncbi:serine/threonine-protein kinase [Gordonibacter pamelaeae]|uniref:serine/threonine-protein kinase n=1 Tax=Gordonibacter pamelaeae TaxID=471189 RepID=UPI002430D801|nr:serine/threonine-protein kinase [Gordonibacter pamelaeae]
MGNGAAESLKALVEEIDSRGSYGNCQKNSKAYVDWCDWIEGIKGRLTVYSRFLSEDTRTQIGAVEYDWDDWLSVSAAIERIHAISDLVRDDLAGSEGRPNSSKKVFETASSNYRRIQAIGSGGAGCVYEVESENGDRYALKLLSKEAARNSRKAKRFLQEVGYCRNVDGEPIITAVDEGFIVADDIKRPFYVMPLMTKSLRSLMDDEESPAEENLALLLTMMSGLKKFYAKDNVHRDVKPQNILFDSAKKRLVLADFGIAHIVDDIPGATVETVSAERLANFTYAAPEQRVPGGVTDQRTDQYAYGLIINELFTGEVPQGSSYKKIAEVDASYAFLDDVVSRMISQRVEDRYPSLEAVLSDIDAREAIASKQHGLRKALNEAENSSAVWKDVFLVGKRWQSGDIVFTLDREPGSVWEKVFRSHPEDFWSTDGYKGGPKHYLVSGKEITVRAVRRDEGRIREVCEKMPWYVEWANRQTEAYLMNEEEKTREAAVKARREELERISENFEMNSLLAEL